MSSHVRSGRFSYGPVETDESAGILRFHYSLDTVELVEELDVGPGHRWSPAAHEAARIVGLLAGVSYFKAGAPPLVDLGETPLRPGDLEFLRDFYIQGLGEFAYRNELDLTEVKFVGGRQVLPAEPERTDLDYNPGQRLLVPFGGGIDSIVTVETLKAANPDMELFVLNRAGAPPFEAIERAASTTGLAIRRAEREIDPWILSPETKATAFNGHVPVTGIVSAIAVLCAVLDGRGRVVMSNEWSSSKPNLTVNGQGVNHQYSKSELFEKGFRSVLKNALGSLVEYFSLLRPYSELWVAKRFATLTPYHSVFHSCNRAFHLDPAQRLDAWCGRCDKCCFIDLILAPFMDREQLSEIFNGNEPLEQGDLAGVFETLLGIGKAFKPFECVGDVDESRMALRLAASRPDRESNEVLARLLDKLDSTTGRSPTDPAVFMRPMGTDHIPHDLKPATLD
ncbi:MAG: hypothetical protein ACP5P1_06480 [Acidimicrobiales bacterium]